MDRITRNKLKTDRFAVEVEHSVEYVSGHKKQVAQYGVIAVAVVAIAVGIWYYRDRQHDQRQQDLSKAVDVIQAIVNPAPTPSSGLTFTTEAAKAVAAEKAFKEVYDKYPGSSEAIVAATYLGTISIDSNKNADAEKYFQKVIDSGDKNYASLAKLSLAQFYLSANRQADAEKLLRSLIDDPTVFVSKEQATIMLARAISASNPAEARKLLTPLSTGRAAVGQVAITLLGQLPAN